MPDFKPDEVRALVERYPGCRYPNGMAGDDVISQAATEAAKNGGTLTRSFLLSLVGKPNVEQLERLKAVPGFPN